MMIVRIQRSSSCSRTSFTLTELLVVMGIIALLSAMTAVGYRAIAKDAKLSSGKNTLMAVLDNARGLAMKRNRIVLVAFRAKPDGTKSQQVEAVLAEWSGESYSVTGAGTVDRFRPIPNVPSRLLPEGIQVAAPEYRDNLDKVWLTGSNLPGIAGGEASGAVIAVMYSGNGTMIAMNSQSDANRLFVDFNNDGLQRQNSIDYDNRAGAPTPDFPDNATFCDFGFFTDGTTQLNDFFCQHQFDDEPYASIAPFIAVYDDAAAHEAYNTATWAVAQTRRTDLSQFITNKAERIHFNRYTGVAMK